jgi:hypothetical protein
MPGDRQNLWCPRKMLLDALTMGFKQGFTLASPTGSRSAMCRSVAAADLLRAGLLLVRVKSSSGRCLAVGTAPGAKSISC